MPTTLEDIKEREEQLKRTGAKATQLAGVGSEFMAQVRDELRKRAEDKGVSELTKAAAATRKEFAAAPARIREEYKDIDPFRRMTLEAERRGDIMEELTEIMDLKGAREKGITDILEMGRAGIQAESERAQAQFGMEQKLYENIVGQWKAEQDIRLKEIDQALELEKIEANRTYQDGMLAYYQGDLDVSRDQLAESQRHAMAAELLDAEKNRITEELGYAGLASQERVAGIQAASGEGQKPTWLLKLFDLLPGLKNPPATAYPVLPPSYALKNWAGYSPTSLNVENPITGDLYAADNETEWAEMVKMGYIPR